MGTVNIRYLDNSNPMTLNSSVSVAGFLLLSAISVLYIDPHSVHSIPCRYSDSVLGLKSQMSFVEPEPQVTASQFRSQ